MYAVRNKVSEIDRIVYGKNIVRHSLRGQSEVVGLEGEK